jgi:hypothetical protein
MLSLILTIALSAGSIDLCFEQKSKQLNYGIGFELAGINMQVFGLGTITSGIIFNKMNQDNKNNNNILIGTIFSGALVTVLGTAFYYIGRNKIVEKSNNFECIKMIMSNHP